MSMNEYGQGPASCGSAAACAVLRAIYTLGGPAARRDIEALSGLSENELTEALRGVRERGIAQVHGRGAAARWVLTRWVNEKRADVLTLIGGCK